MKRATSEARTSGPSVARHIDAKPRWHVHVPGSRTKPPTLNAIGLANVTELSILRDIACIIY